VRRFALHLAALFALTALHAATATAATAPLAWRPFTRDSLAAIRAEQPRGPLVVVFWSAFCAPCREELPHWVRWQRDYPKVRVVLVSTDEGEDRKVAERLVTNAKAEGLEHWAFADEFTERLRWSIDPAWHGELPRTQFYEFRDGAQRAESRLGRLDPASVEAWLGRQRELQGAPIK
jgi:thiol-disulfide isomerase/thioredoxin